MAWLRAIWRLAKFAGITIYYLLIIYLRSLVKGRSMDYGIGVRQRWARQLNKQLNIKVMLEDEPPAGSYLFVSNHRSYLDITVILAYIQSTIVAKAEVGEWPLIGTGARQTYTVMVKREDKDSRRKTREAMGDILEAGYSVVIYPEGTTYEGPGILPLRIGPFEVAESGGFPIIPIAVEYKDTTDAWVGDWGFIEHFVHVFRKKEMWVRLKFGPILEGNSAIANQQIATTWIDAETRRMRLEFDT